MFLHGYEFCDIGREPLVLAGLFSGGGSLATELRSLVIL